jgi:hypothetical protein
LGFESYQELQEMKFMMVLDKGAYRKLQVLAKKRGITIQEYLRAVIIGSYLESVLIPSNKRSLAMKKGWETRRRKQEEAELAAKNEAANHGTGATPFD